MDNYLIGDQVRIDTQTLKGLIGRRVQYLRGIDINKTGRGYFFPRQGVVTDVFRRQIEFNEGGDYTPFSSIREMVVIDDSK